MGNPKVDELLSVGCRATGIGSFPHKDVAYVCDLVLKKCPDIPYWPQVTRVDIRENMLLQFSEGMPCLKPDLEKKKLSCDSSANKEKSLTEFYQNIIDNRYEYFRISQDYARGFYSLLEKVKGGNNRFVKGQVVAPITLLTSVTGGDGRFLIYDDAFSDAVINGLGMKGVWQAKEIKKAGKTPVIFYDEPGLSAFGSAYMPFGKEKVTAILNALVDFIKEREDILVGIHCCGNTDWGMLLESKIDILSFDSFGYFGNFALYSDGIKKFLERDGVIAWGAVPTIQYGKGISLETVQSRLNEAMGALVEKGVDEGLLLKNSLFTPSCGMGTLSEEDSEAISDLTYNLSQKVKV